MLAVWVDFLLYLQTHKSKWVQLAPSLFRIFASVLGNYFDTEWMSLLSIVAGWDQVQTGPVKWWAWGSPCLTSTTICMILWVIWSLIVQKNEYMKSSEPDMSTFLTYWIVLNGIVECKISILLQVPSLKKIVYFI
jgi:hypothetical protein